MREVVIVVDPEPVVCSTVRSILEREGYRVFAVADPQSALETIRLHNAALVITNINLPGMSGHDAMSLFKKACPGVPVLMLSGLPDSEIIRKWMAEEGFDAFPKPFSARQFADKVRQIVAGTDSAMGSR
jgi:two-component system response regulator FlrC